MRIHKSQGKGRPPASQWHAHINTHFKSHRRECIDRHENVKLRLAVSGLYVPCSSAYIEAICRFVLSMVHLPSIGLCNNKKDKLLNLKRGRLNAFAPLQLLINLITNSILSYNAAFSDCMEKNIAVQWTGVKNKLEKREGKLTQLRKKVSRYRLVLSVGLCLTIFLQITRLVYTSRE